MIQVALDSLAVCLELMIYQMFFHNFFGRALRTKWMMAMIYGVLGGVSLVVSLLPLPDSIHVLVYLCIPVNLAFCYESAVLVKLFVPFLFQAASVMVENNWAVILRPLYHFVQTYGDNGFYFYYFTGVVLSNVTILIMVWLLARAKQFVFTTQKQITYPPYLAGVLLFPPCMLFILSEFNKIVIETGTITGMHIFTSVLIMCITIAFIFVFDYITAYFINKEKLAAMEQQLLQEQYYHKVILEKHQAFQQLRHDMRQDFGNIANLIKNNHAQEAMHYAEEKNGKLAMTSIKETGVPLLDSILTVKASQAEEQGVVLYSYVLSDINQLPIALYDLASVCTNALDNAIEATVQIPAPEERKIWFQMVQSDNTLKITVRNTVAENINIQNHQLETTKADKLQHGIGLQIINRITQKYGGTYLLQCEDKIFMIDMLFPLH